MRKRLLLIGFFVFLLVLFGSLFVLDNAQGRSETRGEASVVTVQGQVKILRGPSWNFWAWKTLEPGKELLEGDRIQVGAKSSVEIAFHNKSQVKVQANTLVIIGKSEYYTYEVNQQIQCSSIQVKSGEVWVQVEKALSKVLKFKVESPNTVAGVRGTVFTVKVNRHTTSVAVDEGTVEVSQRTTGEKVLVPGGFQTEVTRSHKPTEPAGFNDENRANLREWAKEVEKSNQKNQDKNKNDKDQSDKDQNANDQNALNQSDKGQNDKDQSHIGKDSAGGNNPSNETNNGQNGNGQKKDDTTKDDKSSNGQSGDDKDKEDKPKDDDGGKEGKPKTISSTDNNTGSLREGFGSNLIKDGVGEPGKKVQNTTGNYHEKSNQEHTQG